jgi:hypothetical protein
MVAYGIILSPWTVLFGLIATATNRTNKQTRIVILRSIERMGPKLQFSIARKLMLQQLHRYNVQPTESLRILTRPCLVKTNYHR